MALHRTMMLRRCDSNVDSQVGKSRALEGNDLHSRDQSQSKVIPRFWGCL